jgi:hypothetical protein
MSRTIRVAMRGAVALALAWGAVGIGATPANAEAPEIEHFDDSNTLVTEDICDFPITVTYEQTGFAITSADGTQVVVHVTERDVFSANGNTLESLPYTFTIHITTDADGETLHAYATGQIIVVPIEDGVTFRAAGRFDFVTAEGDIVVVPETGGSQNLDAFCEALAG